MEQGFSWNTIVVGKPYEGADSWESSDLPNLFPIAVRCFGNLLRQNGVLHDVHGDGRSDGVDESEAAHKVLQSPMGRRWTFFGLGVLGIRQRRVEFKSEGIFLVVKTFLTKEQMEWPRVCQKRWKKMGWKPLGLGALYLWEDLNEEGVLLCSMKMKVNEGALEGKKRCQTFLASTTLGTGFILRACLYPSEKVGPNGLKVVFVEQCPMVFGQRVKEINQGRRYKAVKALAYAFLEVWLDVTAHGCDMLASELLGIGVSASSRCTGLVVMG
nr:hypothetical protein CFP56_73306 [Quercus suber]